MRCSKCGNTVPDWAKGICYRCVQIDKDRKRYGSRRLSQTLPRRRLSNTSRLQTRPEIKLDPERIRMSRALQREGINRFLADVYNSKQYLSGILNNGGFSESEVARLRDERLNDFLTAVVQRWCAWFRKALPSEDAKVLIEQYSLHGRPVPTLSALGTDLGLSKEQIGSLQQRGLKQLGWQSYRRRLEKLVCEAARATLPKD